MKTFFFEKLRKRILKRIFVISRKLIKLLVHRINIDKQKIFQIKLIKILQKSTFNCLQFTQSNSP